MKNILALLMVLCLISCTKSQDSDKDVVIKPDSEIDLALQQSAVEIFKHSVHTENKDKNVMISPISIQQAFGMAASGASDATLTELAKLFGTTGDQLQGVNKRLEQLRKSLITQKGSLTIGLVNGVFHDPERILLNALYKDVLSKHYNPDFQSHDFDDVDAATKAINGWVAEKTENRIEKVLESIESHEIMFLINALYLKSDWDLPFSAETTLKQMFTDSKNQVHEVAMMQNRYQYDYAETAQEQVLKMTLGDKKLEALFILPLEADINDYIQELDHKYISDLYNKTTSNDIFINLPKLELLMQYDLKPILASQGIVTPFTDKAHFQPMGTAAGRIFLTRATHDVYMKMDEKGIEGAAVTTIGVGNTSLPKQVSFNKPFVMVVKDVATGCYLFMGKIENPSIKS